MAVLHMTMVDPLIAVTGLGKSYAGRSVIQNVGLTVMPGDIVGLVGANGGGKTTSLRMIAGLLQPDTGEGRVFGANIRNPKRDCRKQIGYMSQRLALYPDLSVIDNLRFRCAVYGVADTGAAIAQMAADYGLNAVLETRFGHLSGGWARRVQFAASIIHAPPLLLLDEPTAGLDAATRQDIWHWLDRLAAKGHAIIIATHDLVEAERLPSILLYHQGHAAQACSPAEFITSHHAKSLEEAVISHAAGLGV
jgi:ABC-type multidrug transport system ATPase subunit